MIKAKITTVTTERPSSIEVLYEWDPQAESYDKKDRRPTKSDAKRDFNNARKHNWVLMRPHSASSKRRIITPVNFHVGYTGWTGISGDVKSQRVTKYDYYHENIDFRKHFNPRFDGSFDHRYNGGELMSLVTADANERELDVLTALGEMPETIEMFLQYAHALKAPRKAGLDLLRKYGGSFKKRKLTQTLIDDATSAWMHYRYGITPVYYLFNDLRNQFHRLQIQVMSSRKSDTAKYSFEKQKAVNIPYGKAVVHYSVSAEQKLTALIRRVYTLEQLQQKRFAFNPVATMWELTTLSYAVDWAIQFGDYINALTPTCYAASGQSFSTRTRIVRRASVTGGTPAEGTKSARYFVNFPNQEYFYEEMDSYERSVGSGVPQLEIPIGLRMNLKRSLDGFSLSWPHIRAALTQRK